ncbi:hypothetical protein Vadar_004573 [Vaccinium darrowii]|uniref:Uncharacterized protein n=1 Tax=Vaccinium darrowii TaxID=229202 RepID=A0ACB7ZJJ0_9ERIC|nr:hypothetical protein Vadar_004573 [Vaccinium darrowii]
MLKFEGVTTKKLLQAKDFNVSRDFIVLAQETDPLLDGPNQILTLVDILIPPRNASTTPQLLHPPPKSTTTVTTRTSSSSRNTIAASSSSSTLTRTTSPSLTQPSASSPRHWGFSPTQLRS